MMMESKERCIMSIQQNLPVMNFQRASGKRLVEYHLSIASETADFERVLTDDNFTITTATRPFIPSSHAVVKVFIFRMEDATGHLAASCKAYFANSTTLRHYPAPAEKVLARIPIQDDDLRDRLAMWLSTGTSFLFLTDFFTHAGQDEADFLHWFLWNIPQILGYGFGLTFQQVLAVFPGAQKAKPDERLRLRNAKLKEQLSDIKIDLGYDCLDADDMLYFVKDW